MYDHLNELTFVSMLFTRIGKNLAFNMFTSHKIMNLNHRRNLDNWNSKEIKEIYNLLVQPKFSDKTYINI